MRRVAPAMADRRTTSALHAAAANSRPGLPSGMKAAFNGVPQLSVLDGWWVEGCLEGVTGWAVGDDVPTANGHDAVDLYDKLGQVVLPLWHDDRSGWIAVMKGAISKNAAYFNSHRMMRRYATEAYLR